jgi:hypothetical protein
MGRRRSQQKPVHRKPSIRQRCASNLSLFIQKKHPRLLTQNLHRTGNDPQKVRGKSRRPNTGTNSRRGSPLH